MSFKKTITAMALVLGLATPSIADDGDFTGFYAGGQLGYGSGHVKFDNNEQNNQQRRAHLGLSGFLYGLQAGYMYQLGIMMLGLELAYNNGNVDSVTHNGDEKLKFKRLHTFIAAVRLGVLLNSWAKQHLFCKF